MDACAVARPARGAPAACSSCAMPRSASRAPATADHACHRDRPRLPAPPRRHRRLPQPPAPLRGAPRREDRARPQGNVMPTYQIACAQCGEDRWPYFARADTPRPATYTCARCRSLTPDQRANQEANSARLRARWARQRHPDHPGVVRTAPLAGEEGVDSPPPLPARQEATSLEPPTLRFRRPRARLDTAPPVRGDGRPRRVSRDAQAGPAPPDAA